MQKLQLCAAIIILCASCNTEEIGFSKDVNPESIYTSYEITVKENALVAECSAKFRFAGPKGTTLVLSEPSSVSLNGNLLKVDSSATQGAFYAAVVPLASTSHQFVFTGTEGATYNTQFQVTAPLIQQVVMNDASGEMEITFQNIQAGDSLVLSVSDTSDHNTDVEERALLTDNRFVLSSNVINDLTNGPLKINMQIFRTLGLKECPKEGGQMMQRFIFRQRSTEKKSRPPVS